MCIDDDKLAHTVTIAMRMLDNVIDINFYPTEEAQNANLRHRPVGLGIMGFQDALYQLDIPLMIRVHQDFAMRLWKKFLIMRSLASSSWPANGGLYSYKGSKWDRGIFPQDTLDLLEQERGIKIEVQHGVEN